MDRERPTPATSVLTAGAGVLAALVALAALHGVDWPLYLRGLAVVAATAAGMIAVDLVWFQTWRRATSGLTANIANPLVPGRILRKLLGFSGTLAVLYGAYWLLPEYSERFYGNAWAAARDALPWLAVVSPLYILLVDRRQVDPEDCYAQLGGLLIGKHNGLDWSALGQHWLGWAVKGFFLPLMFTFLLDCLDAVWNTDFSALPASFPSIFQFGMAALLLADLLFAVVGYLFTLRLLDTHIRSVEPTFFGWAVCIICYQPFWGEVSHRYFGYEQDGYSWSDLFPPGAGLYLLWGGAILLLEGIYALSTVVFGLRFSNLTHRGIITTGPYRWTKHPAYITKCLSFWMISIPFFPHFGLGDALKQSLLLLMANGIYVARAITEERHLMRDPVYREYQQFIREHGLVAILRRLVLPRPKSAAL